MGPPSSWFSSSPRLSRQHQRPRLSKIGPSALQMRQLPVLTPALACLATKPALRFVDSGISTVDPAPMLILQDARPRPRPQRLPAPRLVAGFRLLILQDARTQPERLPPPRRLSYCFCCFLLQP